MLRSNMPVCGRAYDLYTHLLNNWAIPAFLDVMYVCKHCCSCGAAKFDAPTRRYAMQISVFYGVVFYPSALYAAYAATAAGVIGAVERAWWVMAMIRAIPLKISTREYKLPRRVYFFHCFAWSMQLLSVAWVFYGNNAEGKNWISAGNILPGIKAALIVYAVYDVLWSQRPDFDICFKNDRSELAVHGKPWPASTGPKSVLWTGETASASLQENLLPLMEQSSA